MVVIAWYSTYVVEPVVQSVILVERSPVTESTERAEEINSSTVEEVRQAVTQFLQQQQHSDTNTEHQEQQHQPAHHQEEVSTIASVGRLAFKLLPLSFPNFR